LETPPFSTWGKRDLRQRKEMIQTDVQHLKKQVAWITRSFDEVGPAKMEDHPIRTPYFVPALCSVKPPSNIINHTQVRNEEEPNVLAK